MASITLEARPILGGHSRSFGANTVAERSDLSLVSLAVPQGGDAALKAALKAAYGLDWPAPGRSWATDDATLIWMSPDQLFLMLPRIDGLADRAVAEKIGGAAYLTEQTDSWVILEVTGPDTLAALERICPLDLHDDGFPDGAAARTVMEHLGTVIHRISAEKFLLMSASSSAKSFLHAVETSFSNVVRP